MHWCRILVLTRVFKVLGCLLTLGATSLIVLAFGRNKLLLSLSSHNLMYHLDETGRCLWADHMQFLTINMKDVLWSLLHVDELMDNKAKHSLEAGSCL